MILSELQQFISQNKRASIADLKIHFRMDGDALRGMLNRLIRKDSCGDDATEIYVWVNPGESVSAKEQVSSTCH